MKKCPEPFRGTWRAQPYRHAPTQWTQRQSHAGQSRLVLVVQEIRANKCRIREAREGSTRRQERLVGRSEANAAVGMAEGAGYQVEVGLGDIDTRRKTGNV